MALLRFYYGQRGSIPSPAMYKAMLVAGAKSVKGSLDRHTGAVIDAWPSTAQGWGRINLDDLINPSLDGKRGWHDQGTVLAQGQSFVRTVRVADGSKPVRVVLTWTDPPAAAGVSPTLMNNLDLIAGDFYANAFDSNGWSHNPGCGRPVCAYRMDLFNNVEVATFPPGRYATGETFTVRVNASPLNARATGALTVNNQDFALFVMNGTM